VEPGPKINSEYHCNNPIQCNSTNVADTDGFFSQYCCISEGVCECELYWWSSRAQTLIHWIMPCVREALLQRVYLRRQFESVDELKTNFDTGMG